MQLEVTSTEALPENNGRIIHFNVNDCDTIHSGTYRIDIDGNHQLQHRDDWNRSQIDFIKMVLGNQYI